MMSADRGRSSSTSSLRSEAPKGCIIRPQPVTESSLLDSVAGFINDVQALNKPNHDSKIQITWAIFQKADVNDPALFPEAVEINGNHPPLMLTLGYSQGVQVWIIPVTGEAQEVLAFRQGQVKTLKCLPTPENCFGSPDNFAHCRPLVVMVDTTGPGSAFTSASFISLKTGEGVHNIKFNSEVADVLVNRRVVIMTFREKLAAFDACNLEPRFTVTTCYPSPGVHVNPIALGERWLAYADQQFVAIHRSLGGMIVDGGQSVAAWGINVGSKLAQGVSKLYSNIFSTKSSSPSSCHPSIPPSSCSSMGNTPGLQKGVVTILDVLQVCNHSDRDEVNLTEKMAGVVAHFIAHNKAVVAMEFDTNGTLLLTADSVGNYFNLYKIMAHPSGATYSTVHHLYSLYRGETPGSVQDIAFSPDARWVAVSTLRGTTHLFPITPYGGSVGVRTHTSNRVVNRLSRFHRSAGLDEYTNTTNTSGRSSPNPSLGSSPVISKMYVDPGSGNSPLVIPYPNPYVPPFPAPTLVQPLAQLRQPYLVTLATNATNSSKKNSEELVPIRLAVNFAPSRASSKQTGNIFHRQSKSKMTESLFVMASHGVLLEYTLEPLPDVTTKDNICESSPIKLQVEAFGQWTLTPPKATNDVQPPLSHGNPLMDSIFFGNNPLTRHPSGGHEDKWLSQVEIVTHVGPHRRLWMGPQFCFKTLRPAKEGDAIVTHDLDITCRPEQSNPVNMPGSGYLAHQTNVLIECGSASSFELSPRFANHPFRDRFSNSQDQVNQDLENEIQEAMTETVQTEDNLDGILSGKVPNNSSKIIRRGKFGESSSAEEEFFCLTPEDSRSISSNTSESRSRNASTTSAHQIPDTKIFSVAVEAKVPASAKTGSGSNLNNKPEICNMDNMVVCDVDTDYTGRFAVVSSEKKSSNSMSNNKKSSFVNSNKNQFSKELKIGEDEAVDQEANDMFQSDEQCEKLLAEALQTTVLEEAKEKVTVFETPKVLAGTSKALEENEEDDEEKFEEMSKQRDLNHIDFTEKLDDEDDMKFEEMTNNILIDTEEPSISASGICEKNKNSVKLEFKDFDDNQEENEDEDEDEIFKIKEADEQPEVDEEEDVDLLHPVSKSIDLPPPKCSPRSVQSSDCILGALGNDIVKSIEKANVLYEGNTKDTNSGNLLFKTNNDVSSEDDLEFKPVTSGKNKKKRKNNNSNIISSSNQNANVNNKNSASHSEASSFADSESSEAMESAMETKNSSEGWSFEADSSDIFKLLNAEKNSNISAVNSNSTDLLTSESTTMVKTEEKAALEDVFKFDSELSGGGCGSRRRKITATEDQEDENETGSNSNNKPEMTSSLTEGEEEVSSETKNSSSGGLSQSLTSWATATSTSESEVGNSPNPRATSKKKGKKKKKR